MILSDPNPAGHESSSKDAVLLVDDEKALLDIYVAVLEPFFDTTAAGNAEEAERWLQKKAFKVIVADHRMPGETGLDFLVRARRLFPETQRVLVTGYMKPEMMKTVIEADLFRYLSKPVSIGELLGVVRSAVQAGNSRPVASQ